MGGKDDCLLFLSKSDGFLAKVKSSQLMFVGQDHHADALSDLGAVGSEQEVNLVCLIQILHSNLEKA